MRKIFALTLLLVGFTTLIIWIVSQYIQPILPPSINSSGILFFAGLVSTIGVLAGIKDIIELVEYVTNGKSQKESSKSHEKLLVDNVTHPADLLTPIEKRQQKNFWGSAPDADVFLGRTDEQELLSKYILDESAKLVFLFGSGGVGKTSLASKVAKDVHANFDYVIWRTLRGRPSISDLINEIIIIIDKNNISTKDHDPSWLMLKLVSILRQQRCLLILDNLDTLIQLLTLSNDWDTEFDEYSRLLDLIATSEHQSCVLVTSQLTAPKFSRIAAHNRVFSIFLQGLDNKASIDLLNSKGIVGSQDSLLELIDYYQGNPLALGIVVNVIRSDFSSDATQFVGSQLPVSPDLNLLLSEQFARLKSLESLILFWAAANREAITSKFLDKYMIPYTTTSSIHAMLESLREKSLLQYSQNDQKYSLQGYILDFVTSRMIDKVVEEFNTTHKEFNLNTLFHLLPLVRSQSPDFLRMEQKQVVLDPVAKRLLRDSGNLSVLTDKLMQIVKMAQRDGVSTGYSAGNILNLLSYLGGSFTNLDFSDIPIWQGNLQGYSAHGVDFSNSDLTSVRFSERIGNVHSVAFDNSGSYLAIGTSDGEVRVFRVEDLKHVMTCNIKSDRIIWSVAFNPKNNTLATGSDDNICRIWNILTGECLHVLKGHLSWIRTVAFSKDGDLLATAGDDGNIILWDTITWNQVAFLKGHTKGIRDLEFSQHENILVSCGDDETIIMWNYRTQKIVQRLSPNAGRVRCVVSNPSGELIVSGNQDGSIRVWDTETGKLLKTLEGHQDQVRDLVFSLENPIHLASCSNDTTIRIWDIDKGVCEKVLVGHNAWIWAIRYHPTKNSLLSGSDNQSFKLWDVDSSQCIHTVHGYVHKVWASAYALDNNLLATAGNLDTIMLWNMSDGKIISTLTGHTGWIASLVFDSQGTRFASAGGDMNIRLWGADGSPLGIIGSHENWISDLIFSDEDRLLISSSSDQTIRLWDVATKKEVGRLMGHQNRVRSIAIDATEEYLVSGSEDHTIRVWNLTEHKCVQVLHKHNGWVRYVSASTTGNIFASGGSDGIIHLWKFSPKQFLTIESSIDTESPQITCLDFSKDSRYIASGHTDNVIRIWDVNTRQLLSSLTKHRASVETLSFLDENRLLSTSSDGLVYIWDIQQDSNHPNQVLAPQRPYEGMNISGAYGLTSEQIKNLELLGAISN